MSEITTKNREKLVCFYANPHSEVFASPTGEKPRIFGYAATFGTYSEDLGGFRTTIAAGAFDKVLPLADCRLLINHDPNMLMGRTKSGTLALTADDKGLHFEGALPETEMAAHYLESIRRGDMDGCSFTCEVDVDQWDWSGEMPIRTLIQIGELYDVGPVTYPAFTSTSVTSNAYSLERARRELDERAVLEAGACRARRVRALALRVSLGRRSPCLR